MNWQGKIAVVTGGTSGIGAAIVRELEIRGARVIMVSRARRLKLPQTHACDEWPALVRDMVDYNMVDLEDDASIVAVGVRLRKLPRIDVLVHSAGIFVPGTMSTIGMKEFDRTMQVNVRAPMLLTNELLPLIRASRGQVVFMNSSVVHQPVRAEHAAYATSKHALRALADSLRAEVNADGVRVITAYIGKTATPMQKRYAELAGLEYRPERLLQPEDVARATLYNLELSDTAEVTDFHIRPMQKS